MDDLAETVGWLFVWLLRNTAHASVLAVFVWGLERTLGKRLSPRWRYGLWLVVLARLLLPVAPESHLSLFNLVDFAPAPVAGPALQVLQLPAPVRPPEVELIHLLADTPWWFIGALALWFPGALVLATLLGRDHRRLERALADNTPVLDGDLLGLLAQSKAVMGVRQPVAVVETHQIASPAIAGWWRPRLLLPVGLLQRLTPDETRFLFLHELAHVKRADIVLNWVLAGIQILHWFNPVVWLIVRRLLAVREEVCDDAVLRRSFPGASREYGLTLLRLLEECAPRRLVPTLAGLLDDLRTLRQRMRCIRNFGVGDARPWVPATLTVMVATAGLTERIAEPFFANSSASFPAIERSAVRAANLPTPASSQGTVRPRTEADGESTRKPGLAARVLGALAAVLEHSVESSRGNGETVNSRDGSPAPAPAPVSVSQGPTLVQRPSPTPVNRPPAMRPPGVARPYLTVTTTGAARSDLNSPLAYRGIEGSRAVAAPLAASRADATRAVQFRVSPPAPRPQQLPPVGQRGSILDPVRVASHPSNPGWESSPGRSLDSPAPAGRSPGVIPGQTRNGS